MLLLAELFNCSWQLYFTGSLSTNVMVSLPVSYSWVLLFQVCLDIFVRSRSSARTSFAWDFPKQNTGQGYGSVHVRALGKELCFHHKKKKRHCMSVHWIGVHFSSSKNRHCMSKCWQLDQTAKFNVEISLLTFTFWFNMLIFGIMCLCMFPVPLGCLKICYC